MEELDIEVAHVCNIELAQLLNAPPKYRRLVAETLRLSRDQCEYDLEFSLQQQR